MCSAGTGMSAEPVDFGPVLLRHPNHGIVATATVYQSDDRRTVE